MLKILGFVIWMVFFIALGSIAIIAALFDKGASLMQRLQCIVAFAIAVVAIAKIERIWKGE